VNGCGRVTITADAYWEELTMFPRTLNPLMLVTVTSTVPFLLPPAGPAPERARIGGTLTVTYTQRLPLPIADAEGHTLIATEAKGTNRSTGPTAYMNGADVHNSEIADLVQGTGMHQGYVTFTQGGEEHVSKWSGKVTTVLDTEHRPVTSFEGTWTKVKGPSGLGRYRGRVTGPNAYTVDWQGEVELSQRAASR
jgi:hypothetical protein